MDELLCDFPFADEASKAHTLALLLQPFLRLLIQGPTPLYLIDAPSKGTGKGLLAELLALIWMGRPGGVMALARSEDEVEKRITACLVAAFPSILQPKPAFMPLFEVATTREGSGVVLVSEKDTPPGDDSSPEATNPCSWWRRGRVELPVQKRYRENILQAFPVFYSRPC